MQVLGIDIGGTGIKGAPVDTKEGILLKERVRYLTPKTSSPKKIVQVVKKLVDTFEWSGPIGIGFPGLIKDGRVLLAWNLDKSWLGINAEEIFAEETNCKIKMINDADAAGLAELHFGSLSGVPGTAILITLGTGIGSALFCDGKLIPNTELGHIELFGKDAELHAAERIRIKKKMSWKKWGKQVGDYLLALEKLLSPDIIVLGGGASKKFEKFAGQIKIRAKILPATSGNMAGILGQLFAAKLKLQK